MERFNGEKDNIAFLHIVSNNPDGYFESVPRNMAYSIPESWGLYVIQITKADIQKLLNGDILYWSDEYTIALGLADDEIQREDKL